jgi:hypothetical protein
VRVDVIQRAVCHWIDVVALAFTVLSVQQYLISVEVMIGVTQ